MRQTVSGRMVYNPVERAANVKRILQAPIGSKKRDMAMEQGVKNLMRNERGSSKSAFRQAVRLFNKTLRKSAGQLLDISSQNTAAKYKKWYEEYVRELKARYNLSDEEAESLADAVIKSYYESDKSDKSAKDDKVEDNKAVIKQSAAPAKAPVTVTMESVKAKSPANADAVMSPAKARVSNVRCKNCR